jgi:uncharacterized cysteine cluster protein YcgN (CxxCxxCC family)
MELSQTEWEALCDGCGRCCLHKLEDEDSGEILYTNVACRLLDLDTCRCSRYEERQRWVPKCIVLSPEGGPPWTWLPQTCAYRRLARGQGLKSWHPLVSGDAESVHRAGISVRGWAVSEKDVGEDELAVHLVTWIR